MDKLKEFKEYLNKINILKLTFCGIIERVQYE